MSVFRIHHQTEYTVISNKVIRNKSLSLKTLGLFVKMLSLPPDWDFSIKGLAAICKDGEYAVSRCLQELEQFNYLKRKKVYKDGKVIDIEYDLYECPDKEVISVVENLDCKNLDQENQDNKIKIELNKDNKITKTEKSDSELTDEEFFEKNKNRKDPKTLMKWINIKIADRNVSDAMIQWLKLMIANNKWQTLEILNSKIDMLYENKGDLDPLKVIQDTIEKGYFSFTYSINALKSKKVIDKTPAFKYNKNETTHTVVEKKVELDTSEVF